MGLATMKTFLWTIISITCFCDGFNIRVAREPQVYVVTPEAEPVFLPTPLPEEKNEQSSSKNTSESPPRIKNDSLPRVKNDSSTRRTNDSARAIYSRPSADLVFADFKVGKDKSVSSVKEMLSHERVKTTRKPQEKKEDVQLKDVWDIIRHNQKLEETSADGNNANYKDRYREEKPIVKKDFSKESHQSISSNPQVEVQNRTSPVYKHSEEEKDDDEPRAIRGGSPTNIHSNWDFPSSRTPSASYQRYSMNYPNENLYTNIDDAKYDLSPAPGEVEERYNPAKPYLPPSKPKPPSPPPTPPKSSMPPPPVPMPPPPPPPPPQPVMNPPPLTFDSSQFQGYEYSKPSDTSYSYPKPPEVSYDYPKPPDGLYEYPKPAPITEAPAPPPAMMMTNDDHHHHHHPPPADDDHHHPPPADDDHHHPPLADTSGPSGGGSDNYPSLIFDQGQHFSDADYKEFLEHHVIHDPTTTTTTTTTPAPEKERVNNRYSYYYLGKKLWYVPLYFSVYFIVYVSILICKSIARHKITYPQHYKTKRSLNLSWNFKEEDIHEWSRILTNGAIKYAVKYFDGQVE